MTSPDSVGEECQRYDDDGTRRALWDILDANHPVRIPRSDKSTTQALITCVHPTGIGVEVRWMEGGRPRFKVVLTKRLLELNPAIPWGDRDFVERMRAALELGEAVERWAYVRLRRLAGRPVVTPLDVAAIVDLRRVGGSELVEKATKAVR